MGRVYAAVSTAQYPLRWKTQTTVAPLPVACVTSPHVAGTLVRVLLLRDGPRQHRAHTRGLVLEHEHRDAEERHQHADALPLRHTLAAHLVPRPG